MGTKSIFQYSIGLFGILFYSSCITLNNNQFSKRKYMPDFHHTRHDISEIKVVKEKEIIFEEESASADTLSSPIASNSMGMVILPENSFVIEEKKVIHVEHKQACGKKKQVAKTGQSQSLQLNVGVNNKVGEGDKRISPWATAGLVFSLFPIALLLISVANPALLFLMGALLMVALPFFLMGAVCSIIALHRIKKNPETLKGRGVATWALILALIPLGVVAIVSLFYLGALALYGELGVAAEVTVLVLICLISFVVKAMLD